MKDKLTEMKKNIDLMILDINKMCNSIDYKKASVLSRAVDYLEIVKTYLGAGI